jgi:PAS domain S-box-containing protein
MNFGSRKTNHFSEAQFNLLRQIAPGLAISIQNALFFGEMKGSEEKYRTIIETMQEGYFEVDLAGNFTFVNDAECRSLGYPKNELIGMNNQQYADEKNAKELYRLFNGVYRTGMPVHECDFELTKKDGTKAFDEISVSLIRDSEGKPIGFRGIARDVTERKRMEEALKKSEEEAKRLAQENATMAEIGRIVSSTLNIDDVYERFAEEVRKLIPFDRLVINTINIEKATVINAYMAGKQIADRKVGEVYPLEGSGNAEMVRTKSSLLVQTEDFNEYKDRFSMLLSTFRSGFRSIMNVPLFSEGRIMGGLLLRSLKPYAYMDKDVRLAERVGNQIAGAIANAQLFAERKKAEEALRQSEERYRTIIESMQEGYFEVDLAGKHTFVNDAACRDFGYPKNELIGMNNRQYSDKETAKKVFQAFNKLYRTGELITGLDEEIIRKDGTKSFSEISASLIRNSEGKPIGFRGIARDVTERKRMEEALQKSEREAKQLSQENAIMAEIGQIISSTLNIDDVYERFAEKVRDLIPFDWIAINTINLKDDTVIAAYFTGIDILDIHQGVPLPLSSSLAGEILKTRSSLFIQMKDREEILKRFPRLLGYFEAGFKSMIAVPLISKDEVIGVLHVRSKEVDYTERDLSLAERVGHQIAGAIANAQLFAERKKAEEALRQSEEKYRTIIESMQEGYFESDLDGNYTFVNDANCRFLGYTKEELVGMNYRQHSDEKTVKELREHYTRLYLTGKPIEGLDVESFRKDGTKTIYETSVSLMRDSDGKPIGFRGVSRDVTERKRMEEALQKSEREAKRLAQENELVAEIGRIIGSNLNIEEVYERFVEELHKLIFFDWIAINTINREDDTVIAAYFTGVKMLDIHQGDHLPLSNSMAGEVVKTRSSLFIQKKDREEILGQLSLLSGYFEAGFKSMIAVPLISKDEVIGVLHFRSK